MSFSILYVGTLTGTSLQRARALERLGHRLRLVEAGPPRDFWRTQLYRVGQRLHHPPDLHGACRAMSKALREEPADLVWVDKGRSIGPRALRAARRAAPRARFVHYSPDDMSSPLWNSRQYLRSLPLYDLHVTTKSYNVEELLALGARDVLFVDNAFDPETHRPLELSARERARFACDVGFIGIYEEERARQLLRLARAGVPVSVRGPGWHRLRERPDGFRLTHEFLDGPDYAKAINATRINLGFLRKAARDLQTTRSIEIPACGAFLLAERTGEHRRLFREGSEAEFFDGFDELLEKTRYYLEHETERAAIAAAGRRRCVESGYRNEDRLSKVLEHLGATPRLPAASHV